MANKFNHLYQISDLFAWKDTSDHSTLDFLQINKSPFFNTVGDRSPYNSVKCDRGYTSVLGLAPLLVENWELIGELKVVFYFVINKVY